MKNFNKMTEQQMVKVEGGVTGVLLLIGGTLLTGTLIAIAAKK